jgi:putative transposase
VDLGRQAGGYSHDALYVAVREQDGREASPLAAILDSQSAKSAQKGGLRSTPVGFDAGMKIKGIKRHILTDHQGLLLAAVPRSRLLRRRVSADDEHSA